MCELSSVHPSALYIPLDTLPISQVLPAVKENPTAHNPLHRITLQVPSAPKVPGVLTSKSSVPETETTILNPFGVDDISDD